MSLSTVPMPMGDDSSVPAAEAANAAPLPRWVWLAAAGGVVLTAAGMAYVLWGGSDEAGTKKKKPKQNGQQKHKVTLEDVPDEEEEEAESEDALERALGQKNKGNKYFKGGKYQLAIDCYSKAIELCPAENKQDLSTMYQNRAAAQHQLNNYQATVDDCTRALELNSKYVKALDRRARACRVQAQEEVQDGQEAVAKLKQSLEDITAVCILEGFQKQEHLMLVDSILKELGKAEAKVSIKHRQPMLTSRHFIEQYFQSFAEDPIMQAVDKDKEAEEGDSAKGHGDVLSGYARARHALRHEQFADVIPACTQELDLTDSAFVPESLLLRGTFYILSKQQELAFADLSRVAEDADASPAVRVNALIKRASLYIQQCNDPIKDPEKSLADFEKAAEIDAGNADIYHHRGQVHLLIDQVDKALSDFSKATELKPGFPIAYVQKLYTDYRKVAATQDKVQIRNVMNQFEQAVEKFPKCIETYALYAQVLTDQGEFERADALYERAEKVDPHNANLLVHRGLILLQWRGDIKTAVERIQRALEVDDKCEFAYETLGTVEVQRGNLKRAVELFDKAIPLANTELEMAHLFGLRDAAVAQTTVSERMGVTLPTMM